MKQSNVKRSIYLNLFKIVFIIMIYFYISELFSSISSPYVLNEGFSIQFSVTLLLFGFLSILAGPIQGLISGFLGELLYQMAYYHAIYIDWCLLVALIGFVCGIYRYKPLKYHEGMKVYYTFLNLVILTFIVMILIFLFQIMLYQNPESIDLIFINYGFKFFTQSLISLIFPIPILLIIYDKVLSSNERIVYNLFLTHHPINASDHTYYLEFGRTRIYFCSRCSGVVLGIILSIFFFHFINLTFNLGISPEIALILCAIFPVIGIVDWGTQKLQYRKSTTFSRLLTGLLIGFAMNLISYTGQYYLYLILIITVYFVIFFLLVYLGNRKEMKKFKKELNPLSEENKNLE